MDPQPRWTEEMLRSLEPHEHDFQEFKGSGWIVDDDGGIASHFHLALSKQVSAFSNGAGGRLFIGLDDNGLVDGGVPVDLKGGGTRAWLEDLVPFSVEPKLPRCNVFEVRRDSEDSAIDRGCAVYVIELPDSSRAPHQAKDHKYYLRIAGKSRPMGHVHVQDVLRRTHHPRISLSRLGPYGTAAIDDSDPRGPEAFLQFRAFLVNEGRNLATHVGVEILVPRPFAGSEVRRRMREAGEVQLTQTPGLLTFFRYHPVPIFPTQEVYGVSVWVCLHRNNLSLVRAGAELSWTIYADDAEPVTGSKPLGDFMVVQRALAYLEELHGPDEV